MVSAGSDLLVLAGNICWFCCSCNTVLRIVLDGFGLIRIFWLLTGFGWF